MNRFLIEIVNIEISPGIYTTKIINTSDYNLILSKKPKKPKKTVIDILSIKPKEFYIIPFLINFDEIYISFEVSK